MIKVILTTNFSESARNASVYAIQLFGTDNVEYTIMNTIIDSPTGTDGVMSAEGLSDRSDAERLRVEEDFFKKVFAGKDLKIESTSVHGHLVAAINELTKQIGANYVVIGNRSSYDFDASILRAKTYEMIEKIECPVLAVPEGREFSQNEGGLIFASDLKTINKPDHLEPLIRLAVIHDVPVKALHVKKPDVEMTTKHEEAGTQLNQIFAQIPLKMHELEHEDVTKGIIDFVESNGPSLLVLLARRQNFIQRLTRSSLAKEFSKMASMPLLILHDY